MSAVDLSKVVSSPRISGASCLASMDAGMTGPAWAAPPRHHRRPAAAAPDGHGPVRTGVVRCCPGDRGFQHLPPRADGTDAHRNCLACHRPPVKDTGRPQTATIRTIEKCIMEFVIQMETPPISRGRFSKLCSAVSYFSTLWGSIIGAGRLSFRVRDGTGRFPAAMAAVTLFTLFRVYIVLVVGCSVLIVVVWLRAMCVRLYSFRKQIGLLFWLL